MRANGAETSAECHQTGSHARNGEAAPRVDTRLTAGHLSSLEG